MAPIHDVDSNEMAFKIAGSMALRKVSRWRPVLLEPMMKVEVVTPEEYMGDVMGDLNRVADHSRNGRECLGQDSDAEVPLAKCLAMQRICVQLPGRATYTMEFAKYAEAPQYCRGNYQKNRT